MKKIILNIKIWLTNWRNYFGLILVIYLFIQSIMFIEIINEINRYQNLENFIINISKASVKDIITFFIFPLLAIIPFSFGYPLVQFLVDSILLFAFKFSVEKTIKIENYIFLLIALVFLIFNFLLPFTTEETKNIFLKNLKGISIYVILVLLIFILIWNYTFFCTQKKRIPKIKRILEN